jgi:hypothetical protein
MKILLVSSGSGSRGGGEIFLNYLGGALAARGHSVMTWMPAHARMNELASQCAKFSQVIRAEFRNTYDHRSRSLATVFNARESDNVARQWAGLNPGGWPRSAARGAGQWTPRGLHHPPHPDRPVPARPRRAAAGSGRMVGTAEVRGRLRRRAGYPS